MKQIIIEVGEDGTIKIDAIGFQGPACDPAGAFAGAAKGRGPKA